MLKLVKRLLDTGISLQQIRTAVDQLREAGIERPRADHAHERRRERLPLHVDDEVIDLVSRGQGVFGIAVGKVLREVESTLVELDAQPADPMDELAARRAIAARAACS